MLYLFILLYLTELIVQENTLSTSKSSFNSYTQNHYKLSLQQVFNNKFAKQLFIYLRQNIKKDKFQQELELRFIGLLFRGGANHESYQL